ncbi:MAG: hypothetical protein CMI95_03135 [Pelagibacteraceae bacterium]|nr:hypothetical protein [Pelagibacteraceae bacterium]|tara:strand:- start:32398 stop:33714 length:1317 start_codon:yes stop_codon:yes gene_type:complete
MHLKESKNLFFNMKKISLLLFILLIPQSLASLTIEESIKNSVLNNTTIKIALEEIEEAKELVSLSATKFKPDIALSFTEKQSSTETTTSTSSSTVDKLEDSYSLTVSQNLYSGGRNQLDLKRSKILFNKQIENFYISLNDLILNAINGYLTVQVYENSLIANTKTFEVVETIYNDTLTKKNLGTATLVDLKNAESSYELAKSNMVLAKGNIEVGKRTFKRIVGLDPIDLEEILNINDKIEYQEIIDTAIINNHEIKILNFDLDAASLQLEIKKKAKLPSLDLTGTASYNDNVSSKGTETKSANLSATLSIPIYQKGVENSDIRKYQSQYSQTQYRLDDKKETIKLQASILLNNFRVYQSQYDSSTAQINANEIALEITKKEYESGIKTFSDLINQEEQLLTSKLNRFNIKKDLIMTYFEILSLEGVLVNKFQDYLPEI